MYFLYFKTDGRIIVPVCKGEPDDKTVKKEAICGIGSGVKWENVDLFYASDEEFADDFVRAAPLGKYYIKNDEVKKHVGWKEPKRRLEE